MNPTDARVEEFLALVARHQRRLSLFVHGLVHNPADAEDILQETSLVLWREFDKFEPGSNFGGWACTVAFHQVMAWRKKRQRDRLVFSDEFLTAVAKELMDDDRHEERAKALAACAEKLPPHHRELLRKRYTDGRSVEELSAAMGRNPDAVYRMLSRIRQALYDCTAKALS